MPTLAPELTFRAELQLDDLGTGPFGSRVIANVTGGKFSGDRLTGKPIGAGADWLLIGGDGYGRLNVRATFQTDDGANIYVHYHGVIEVTEAIGAILGGADNATEFGDQYFFTNPRMETGDERYAWVNRTMFLGQGRILAGPAVEYVIYRVDN
ncbi:DUF3237 domain-containing protein [Streptomyces sp. NPDC046805]|uniref:DUF3237 domain-containing protein n=1 Tax=Streptomyces sp. NPDC046805 TaxID=3155134 RepID=UPI0033C0867D